MKYLFNIIERRQNMQLDIHFKSGKEVTIYNYSKTSFFFQRDNVIEEDLEDLKFYDEITYRFKGSNQVVVNGSEISYVELYVASN